MRTSTAYPWTNKENIADLLHPRKWKQGGVTEMLDLCLFAMTCLALLLVSIIWLRPSSKRVTTIPGLDPTSKEDGHLCDIYRAGSLHEFLLKTHERLGPIAGFWWGQAYVVSIASPELFKQHSAAFDKPAELFQVFKPLWGQYAISSETRFRKAHYERRFSHENLHMYYEDIQKAAEGVEKKWLKIGDQDHIPLSEHMFSFTIKTSLLILLGESFSDEKLVLSFRNAYEKVWHELEYRLKDQVIPDEKCPRMVQFNEALEYVYTTLKKVIKHREEHSLHKQGQRLIDDIQKINTNEDVILSDMMTYLIASFHTIANTLTWCIYFLATHKNVQDKLYKEIMKVLGDSGVVKEGNFGQLRYLNQVINETLRCAAVAPWTARVQDFDSELGGHKIPKNTPVIHALGVVWQDETIWPLPNNFDPERFSIENRKNRSTYAFAPFGFAGKRQCPASKLSYLEITVLLATIIRRFDISLWGKQVPQPIYGLVSHPKDEIWIKVAERH